MPSSKKKRSNAGRARKERQNANTVPFDTIKERAEEKTSDDSHHCTHGWPSPAVQKRCCYKFFKTIEIDLARMIIADEGPFTAALKVVVAAHEKNPNVLLKAANCKMIEEFILSHCVADVLDDDSAMGVFTASLIAVLCVLDHFDSSSTLVWREVVASISLKNYDAIYGCERSIIRFFHQRSPCACLEAKYSVSKSLPKTGICCYCGKRKPKSDLFVCQGCKLQQVCSYECHLAIWPNHKEFCKEVRDAK